MRITAGRLRGRRLSVPDLPGVRPTPSRVRQALFNILGPMEGMNILELFSGSGLMALEALSRGAAQVISLEKDRRMVSRLKKIRGEWSLDNLWHIQCSNVQSALPRLARRRFDLIFADPPYDKGISTQLPAWLDAAGISCAQLVIEEAACVQPVWPAGWTQQQMRRYGGTCLHFLKAEAT